MYVMGHLQVPSRDPHPLAENVLKVSFQGLTQPILELGCLHGSIISSLNGPLFQMLASSQQVVTW